MVGVSIVQVRGREEVCHLTIKTPIELSLTYSVQYIEITFPPMSPLPQSILFRRLGLYEGKGLELQLQ